MKKKSEIELERAKISKITRSLIRLKHSIKADEEINNILPETLNAFDTALQLGELKKLRASIEDILSEV